MEWAELGFDTSTARPYELVSFRADGVKYVTIASQSVYSKWLFFTPS